MVQATVEGATRLAAVSDLSTPPQAHADAESGYGLIDPDDIAEPVLRALYGYWDGLRAKGLRPRRADIDPLEMRGFLPHVFLADTAEHIDDFRFRLYGTAVVEGFGEDRTGWRFEQHAYIENVHEVNAGYLFVRDNARPHYLPNRVVSHWRDYQGYSRLLMPLFGETGQVEMIIGGAWFFLTGEPDT